MLLRALRPIGPRPPQRFCEFEGAPQSQVEHDLMMPQPLPALYQTEAAYHAIMAAAHASKTGIPEPTHGATACTGASPCQILTRGESNVTAIRSIRPRVAKMFCV